MASFAQTLKQNVRTRYRRGPGGLDSLELRGSNFGALSLYRKQTASPTGAITGELKTALENSFGRVVQAPVIDYINPTIGNTRTCAVQVGGLNSKLVTFEFFTLSFGFPIIRSQFINNELGEQDYIYRMFEARRLAAMTLLDQKCVDHLELSKNQYFPAPILAYFPEANDALQVSDAERLDYYNFIQSILETMDLTGTPDVLANPMSMADVRKIQGQGTTDEGDLSYVLDGVGSFFSSNRVIAGAGNRAVQYLVGNGAVGIVSRIDPDCDRGVAHGGAENPVREWTKQDVPGLGTMGLYYRQDCSDESATSAAVQLQGLTRTSVESMEWSADYCLVKVYTSDEAGRFFPIIKVEQKLAA
ncbi:hypothetical protein SAMN06265337_0640 [Hymenobacter gelipurpurascens]|uniref:Phage major capsid protein E n=1 Tax=Hymenobacter gelipurpurascens TaxID=89968 RepID=A0A212T8D1_9BACT|nr:hypothetical protein [Hymenobacter gelipurpurascens]SNC62288.1 hypothetical protein SAMN06265337_0640 [Hymenobacter gelipurpurascens]